jgi:predicted secreted hydrolase
MRRRQIAPSLLMFPWLAPAGAALPTVSADRQLAFPRDFGAHPAARTEWWYATGWLEEAAATPGATAAPAYGFQVTFFRSRTEVAEDHPSRFAARQLLFAHAALTDLRAQRAVHDQRIARVGFEVAAFEEADTQLRLRDWALTRAGPAERSRYTTRVVSEPAGFAFELALQGTQPPLLQGSAGFSRKGPRPAQASHYYTQPQLEVSGSVSQRGVAVAVRGRAWLDHEWSDALLDEAAVGWDWIGMNLADGSALTAFRLRRADGSTLWAGGSLRAPGQPVRSFAADEVRMTAQRHWTSAASALRYPVQWRVDTPAGRHTVRALLDAQELDSRASTGAIYWEGLSELLDANGTRVGLGYLEMTGYGQPLRL